MKKLWLTISLVFFLIIFELTPLVLSQEQLSVGWIETFDGGSSDQGYDVAVDSANNIVVTGVSLVQSASNFLTVKYGSSGNQLWTRTYEDGTQAKSIAVDSEDNVIVTGHAFNGFIDAISTIKYDENGATQWNVFVGEEWRGEGVAVDSQDNVIVVGYYYVEDVMDQWDLVIVKYGSNGNQLWSIEYDDLEGERAFDVAVDSNDNIAITGMSYDGSTRNLLVLKYDKDGNFLWKQTFNGGYEDEGHSICVDSMDNIVVTGFTANSGESHSLTTKYDPDGNKLWTITNEIDNQDEASSITVDSQDNILVTGWTFDGIARTLMTLEYDKDGNQLWQESYAGSPTYGSLVDVKGYGIAVDSLDNIIITGTISYIVPQKFSDFFTIKYLADGNEPEPNGDTEIIVETQDIIVDGNTFQVTTESNATVSDSQFVLEEMKLQLNVAVTTIKDGFCNITIPNQLLGGPFNVLVDGETESNTQSFSNETHSWIYITYSQGNHQIEIIGSTAIPEFSSIFVMIILFCASLVIGVTKKISTKK